MTPDKHGYGRVWFHGRQVLAHRAAYCLHNNAELADIAGKVVRHECDNPRCVKPQHLLLGTQVDNIRDMDQRGRRVSLNGVDLPQAKLNEALVKELRATSGTLAVLAAKFGIGISQVRRVKTGRAWKHVKESE